MTACPENYILKLDSRRKAREKGLTYTGHEEAECNAQVGVASDANVGLSRAPETAWCVVFGEAIDEDDNDHGHRGYDAQY